MFDLIDCSAFETSATVATLNDFFFPVVLFAAIFWVLCEIFLDVSFETQSFLIDKQFASDGNSTDKDNTQQAGDNFSKSQSFFRRHERAYGNVAINTKNIR